MTRITKADLAERQDNLNRRMAHLRSRYRYTIEGRYGYTAIDRVRAEDGAMVQTVRTGMTKSEAGDFLHAMMVALDDASYPAGDVNDVNALDRINEILSQPEWSVGMLEDIAEIVHATGREDVPDPDYQRH